MNCGPVSRQETSMDDSDNDAQPFPLQPFPSEEWPLPVEASCPNVLILQGRENNGQNLFKFLVFIREDSWPLNEAFRAFDCFGCFLPCYKARMQTDFTSFRYVNVKSRLLLSIQ